MEVLRGIRGSPGSPLKEKGRASFVLLQELIVDEGIQYLNADGWILVSGKTSREWRGEGIAFRTGMGVHENSKVMHAAVVTTFVAFSGRLRIRLASVHIPHHATVPQTEEILASLEQIWDYGKVLVGIDANKTFLAADRGERATSARGEAILNWMTRGRGKLPDQCLEEPTHFPYNPAFAPRRLDYVIVRGLSVPAQGVVGQLRDVASSDHEPVTIEIPWATPGHNTAEPQWGPRKLGEASKVETWLMNQAPEGDLEHAIAEKAKQITIPGKPTLAFVESQELKAMRGRAKQLEAGDERRSLWKRV